MWKWKSSLNDIKNCQQENVWLSNKKAAIKSQSLFVTSIMSQTELFSPFSCRTFGEWIFFLIKKWISQKMSTHPHWPADCFWKHLNTVSSIWLHCRPSVWSSRRAALHWLHVVKCLPSGQPPSLWSHLHCRSRQAWVWRPGFLGHVSCSGCPPSAWSPLW